MINDEYANAYSEVLCILSYISEEDYNKIPSKKIELFEKKANKEYKVKYDPNKTLSEQNISKRAKAIIAILFRDYWATSTQQDKILMKQKQDRQGQFSNKINNFYDVKNNTAKVNRELIEYKEEQLWKRVVNKIKRLFNSAS